MLDVHAGEYRGCDGVSRRSLLRVGFLGLAGLALPDVLRARALGATTHNRKTSVIQIVLGGGLTHMDSYDLKPKAPKEFRGEFQPIATKVPGIEFGELLPAQARIADKMAVIRSMQHGTADHDEGTHWIMTGYRFSRPQQRENDHPSIGSVAAKMRGDRTAGLPAYVSLPNAPRFGNASYLGAGFNPYGIGGDPTRNVEAGNLRLARGLDVGRLEDRRGLLRKLDELQRERDAGGTMEGLDQFNQQAYDMITGPNARAALDLTREDPKVRERYGMNRLGQSCLLARRLVEAGVTFVTVTDGGWDHHGQVFQSCRRQLPAVDTGFAALVEDLYARGRDQDVLVVLWSEFGRTPRINNNAGRDHWPNAMCVALAGGGLKMGQVIGSTNSKGERPVDAPCGPEDLIRTMYHVLGVNPLHEFRNESGRPMPILNKGQVIPALVG